MNAVTPAIPREHIEAFRKELATDRFVRDERSYNGEPSARCPA